MIWQRQLLTNNLTARDTWDQCVLKRKRGIWGSGQSGLTTPTFATTLASPYISEYVSVAVVVGVHKLRFSHRCARTQVAISMKFAYLQHTHMQSHNMRAMSE